MVQTIHDTRRQRLGMLISRYGSIADLNEALKWPRTDARLTRVKNANARTDRKGQVFQMGDTMARDIEEALGLPAGWMDTPPTYAELHGVDDPVSKTLELLQAMEPEMQYRVVRMVTALSEPSTGTHGQQQ